MQVVILCGGMGTRAYPYTQRIPKALMEINGRPIVEEVMRIYAAQGYRDFILSCGYLKEAIFEHFQSGPSRWNVRCIDTGADADTGDRVYRLQEHLGSTFHLTYCDGLGDIDIAALVACHQAHGAMATVTATRLRSQYGLIYADRHGVVTGFDEKPVLPDYWINGGFFVLDRRVFDVWKGSNLERDILPALAERSQLHVHKHLGFWRSMDTYKDQQELTQLWAPYAARYSPPQGAPV